MISYIYIFLLTIFYDNINIVIDYFIILSLISSIIILGLFYKKLSFKYLALILISSLIIDLIAFNYLFSVFLIAFIPIIILNKLFLNYNIPLLLSALITLLLSFLALLVIDFNFYQNISFFEILLLILLSIISNSVLLRSNVFRF